MHGLKEEGEEKRKLITGIRGVGLRKTEEKEGKDKSEENPDSRPQPGPWTWSRSEEVDRFCTRVFKKSNHNKVDLASFEPLGITMSVTQASPASPPDSLSSVPARHFRGV